MAPITNGIGMNDQLTAYKVALMVLIEEYCKVIAVGSQSSSVPPVQRDVYSEKEDREMMMTLLTLIQSADLKLKELLQKVGKVAKPCLLTTFTERLQKLSAEGIGAIMDLFETLPNMLFVEQGVKLLLLHRSSILGQFVRRMLLIFDTVSFAQLTQLFAKYRQFHSGGVVAPAGGVVAPSGGVVAPGSGIMAPGGGVVAQGGNIVATDPDMNLSTADSSTVSESSFSFMQMSVDENATAARTNSVCDVGRCSRKQAEFFIAQQAALLEHNEVEALPPQQLQEKLSELLISNPSLAEAHFLSYMNYMRIKEYCGAMDSLHDYFDRHLVGFGGSSAAGKQKPDDEVTCRGFRYAALNMASLQYRFGHRAEAHAAVQEAIRMAQETNDNVCLQHALGWLQRLSAQRSDNNAYMLDRLVTKAGELNLAYLTSLGVQAFAHNNARAKMKPSSIFEFLLKSDTVNCQHSLADLMCISYAQKAALWDIYGRRELCSMNSQIMLQLNTLDLGVYRNGETECLALCHLANIHADQGDYSRAASILRATSLRFPPHCHSSLIWMFHEQRLLVGRALHHGAWAAAAAAVDAMAAVNGVEASYSRCTLLKEKGEMSTAFDLIQTLLSRHEHAMNQPQQQPELYARLLMLLAELHCASDDYPAATQPLLQCIAFCKQHNFSYMVALATMSLAFVQFCLGMPRQALSLIEDVLVPILSHRCLYDQARTQYLWIRCRVAAATNSADKQAALYSGVQAMNEVIQWFKTIEAHLRTKDAIYYQARLYNELGYANERNECALQFHKLDKQYPTRPGTAFMAF